MDVPGTAIDPSLSDFSQVGFLLDQALQRVAHVRGVILLTTDGLERASNADLPRDVAQRMAAAACTAQAVCRSMGEFVVPPQETEVRTGNSAGPAHIVGATLLNVLIEFEQGYVLVTAAAEGSFLAVAAGREADLRQVGQWIQRLVDSVGTHLAASSRHAGASGS